MKVSIITATYNSQTSVWSAINSVNNQSYNNIEHVFIDGNSTDKTLKIIKASSTRENIIISEKDQGIYDALNKGIKNSTGDIIGLVHSDDILATDTIIEEIVACFKRNQLDGLYGDLFYVKKDNLESVVRYWKGKAYRPQLLYTGWMPAHPTLFLKKDIYIKHGSFDISYQISADYHFVLRIIKDPSISLKYLPKIISKMRTGGASNRSMKNILRKSNEDYRALKDNEIKHPLLVLIKKNISKISQFHNSINEVNG